MCRSHDADSKDDEEEEVEDDDAEYFRFCDCGLLCGLERAVEVEDGN